MGGFGSGRQSCAHTRTTEQLPALQVSMWRNHQIRGINTAYQVNWRRNGKLAATALVRTGMGQFSVQWIHTRFEIVQPIRLSWTQCNYGGSRAWFICPKEQCHRRVTKLYVSSTLACRHCLNLRYRSKAESTQDRAIRRLRKTRHRLSWSANLFSRSKSRPKRMRSNTYRKLLDRHTKQMKTVTLILRNQSDKLRGAKELSP